MYWLMHGKKQADRDTMPNEAMLKQFVNFVKVMLL